MISPNGEERKNMKKYMHTLSGRPGLFDGQIVHAGKSIRLTDLVDSLEQIRKEQKLSKKYREDRGWHDEHLFHLGYMIVYINL